MPASGLRRRFNQTRAIDGSVTAADICRMAHYYFVSVEAMALRLEELRLLPGGTVGPSEGQGLSGARGTVPAGPRTT